MVGRISSRAGIIVPMMIRMLAVVLAAILSGCGDTVPIHVLTVREFFGIKPGSFLYAAGVRSGDELVEAWEHDGSHDVVPGTRITITDYDDALGIVALFPATGADLALSFKVQRGAQAYTFHLDPR